MRGGVQYGGAAAGEELNLGMIARAIRRHKLLIIGPTLIVAAVAFIGASLMTPRYKSEARVLIEGRENIFLRPEAEKSMTDRGTIDAETVTSQVQLALSRDLAREVIKELNLVDSPEFNAALRESSPLSLLRTIGILKDPMSMAPEERVLAAYYDRLTAYAIDKSRVIAIEFQSADPDLAARGANLIAKRYLSLQQTARQDQTRSAGLWLSGELEKLRGKVTEAEAKVEDFRAKSNLYIGSNNTGLVNQQLTELSSQVSAARAQKADAEARARSLRDALRSGQSLDSVDITTSELIRRLSEQLVTLKAQLAEQSSTLLPQHPRIKELKAQIADLERQIRGEGDRIARALEREAKLAGSRLETLSANLDQLKRQTSSTSDQDVQLRALEREAKAQRDLFESYLAKYRETTARDSIAAAPADARIISSAVVSNIPYFPKKMPITLIAALGTFCLSMAFVVTAALLNGENYRQARRKTDMDTEAEPVVRSADARTRAEDQWHADPNPPESEAPPPAQPSAAQPVNSRIDKKSAAAPNPWMPEVPPLARAFTAQADGTKLDEKLDVEAHLPPEVLPFAPAPAPQPYGLKLDELYAPRNRSNPEVPPLAWPSAPQSVSTDLDEKLDAEAHLSQEVPSFAPAPAPQPVSTSLDEPSYTTRSRSNPEVAPIAWPSAPPSLSTDLDESSDATPNPWMPDAPTLARTSTEQPANTDLDEHLDAEAHLSPEVPSFAPTSAPQPVSPTLDEPSYATPNLEAPPLAPASAPQPAGSRLDDVVGSVHSAGDVGRRVAVIGCARGVGTTLTAIALTRVLSRTARVVLVDLAFASANVDVISKDPAAFGIADLVRGEASFSDIIIRDPGSSAHLVTVGQVSNDASDLLQSQVLWDAVYALAQSYDYLVLDAGAQSDTTLDLVAETASYAVLVCGDTPVTAISGLAGQLHGAGFAHVAIMSGSPPALEEATAQSAA